ncbi:MAG: aldehyde ferredoxin oxidoreductase N-terminal domain-containing protein [Chloroflexota bacterium]
MAKLYGWAGKLLRVDLSSGKLTDIPTTEYVPKFLGGRGLACKIYWDEVSPGVGAFDPENVLIFTTGPYTGTLAPHSGKVNVTAKSPMWYPREAYFQSTFGGHWGAELKFAGYDGIVIKGKAARPVYLWINDGQAEIRDASRLWGYTTDATQEDIWRRHGEKTRVAAIGPAGENRCRGAVIISDAGNATGTGGFGAVMGSKNLKAIAVRGTMGVPVARPKDLMEVAYRLQRLTTRKQTEKEPPFWKRQNRYSKSFKDTALDEEAARGTVRLGYAGCWACTIMSRASVKFMDDTLPGGEWKCHDTACYPGADDRYYGGKHTGRVAWETSKVCDLLGLNNQVYPSFVKKLVELGVLTSENTGLAHIEDYGSREWALELLDAIAHRKGIGDLLGEDRLRCFHKIASDLEKSGDTEKARKVKDEINKICQRRTDKFHGRSPATVCGVPSLMASFVYPHMIFSPEIFLPRYKVDGATDPILCDDRGNPLPDEAREAILKRGGRKFYGDERALLDREDWYKAKMPRLVYMNNLNSLVESLMFCHWPYQAFSIYTGDRLAEPELWFTGLYPAITGIDATDEEMLKTGDRLYNLERAIWIREGWSRYDEWANDYFFEKNKWADREKLKEALDEYYRLRGWDVSTGWQTRAKLEELGLEDVARELESLGKLAG